MRSYTFRWAHPAEAVYVTGTFDNWAKTERLNRRGDAFEKTIVLPDSADKILYKFVADGAWKHDPTAKTETDHEGNINNVLEPHDVHDHNAPHPPTISSVAPTASTVAMAGQQPLEQEKETPIDAPGAFPITPQQDFSVNPIPASAGAGNPVHIAPGEKVPAPSTINNNTIESTVRDDPTLVAAPSAEQTFGVAPIPATGGAGNPIHLQPGEKVPDPSTITGNTVESTVNLGPDAYQKADAAAPVTAPTSHGHAGELAAGAAGVAGVGALGAAAASGLGDKSKPIIPESSLGMGANAPPPVNEADFNPQISSVAPTSTTAQLAGQVPKEPRPAATISSTAPTSTTAALAGNVPLEPRVVDPTIASAGPGTTTAALAGQVPKEPRAEAASNAGTQPAPGVPQEVAASQQQAHVGPEASANPEAVREKSAMEKELERKVPEAPVTSDDTVHANAGIAGAAAAGATAVGAAAIGAAAVASKKFHETTGTDPSTALPESVQNKIAEQNAASIVPPVVAESQQAAHAAPEASANTVAVREKDVVEQELKSKVPESQAAGQPAPTVAAVTSTTAPTSVSATGAPQLANPVANVSPISMDEKPAGSQELNAPAGAAASTPAVRAAQLAAADAVKTTSQPSQVSRDVSPMTRPTGTDNQTQPTVTTGVSSSTTPAQSKPVGTPRTPGTAESGKRTSMMDRIRNTPDSQKTGEPSSPSTDKKEKRKSFFGRIKDKIQHHK